MTTELQQTKDDSATQAAVQPPSMSAVRRAWTAPAPGGMGVIETGLIAGFTASGIPEAQAVAATFTARMCTSYLPPIWGWFALSSLRKKEYV